MNFPGISPPSSTGFVRHCRASVVQKRQTALHGVGWPYGQCNAWLAGYTTPVAAFAAVAEESDGPLDSG